MQGLEARGARLVVVSQEVSDAQREYQKARVTPGAISNLFYKDATPRAEHFIKVTVKLLGREQWPWHAPVPLRLLLCYDDGTPMDASDQSSLRVLSLSSHVRAAIPADSDAVSFSYRIELGSFRRADRSFAVKIEVSPEGAGDPLMGEQSSSLSGLAVEPALTPAVYVLSKKKLEQPLGTSSTQRTIPQVNGKRKHDEYDDDSDDSARKMHIRSLQMNESRRIEADHIIHRLEAVEKAVSELTSVIKTFMSHLTAFSPRDVAGMAYHEPSRSSAVTRNSSFDEAQHKQPLLHHTHHQVPLSLGQH